MSIKIALDVDGVLADFSSAIIAEANKMGYGDKFPKTRDDCPYWNMCEDFNDFLHVFEKVSMKPEFWLNVRSLGNHPNFVPEMYLTSRPIETAVSKRWLKLNLFPDAPVETVSIPSMKLEVLQNHGVHVLIDDYYKTVAQVNESPCGTLAVLFEAPYQRGHQEEIKDMPKTDVLYYEHIHNIYRSSRLEAKAS